MDINFFDDAQSVNLLPLTFTRPCALLSCGMLSLVDKWKNYLPISAIGFQTDKYLANLFPSINAVFFINGRLIPDKMIVQAVLALQPGDYLMQKDTVLAYHTKQERKMPFMESVNILNNPSDIFVKNGQEIIHDFSFLDISKYSTTIDDSNTIIGDKSQIYAAPGAKIVASILNTKNGPIYIGKDAEIMEGCMVRGPFSMGENAVLKMGSKIYEGTSIGNFSKIGGEVNNTVIFSYSNKGHDGFLGNSVIGEWCNLGADTNNSNLKNNYEEVKLWNYASKRFEKTGLQFCGLIMGDHSKTGINTMLNTGTVIGVSCNIFGSGFPRNFVPSFAWGGAAGFTTYQIDKALQTASLVYQRRKKKMQLEEEYLLKSIFDMESENRIWENKVGVNE